MRQLRTTRIVSLSIAVIGLACLLTADIARAANVKEIRLGVLAFRGPVACMNRWTPTAEYLTNKLEGFRFRIVPLTLKQMEIAVRDNKVDFVFTNPGNYINLETRYGISRIATMKSLDGVAAENHFGAVIITRSDRKDIRQLPDLKNKSFMAVRKNAFGGFQMAWRTLKNSGIDPLSDFHPLTFAGFPQDQIIFAIRDRKVDAGTVRTGLLESLHEAGKINISDFRVLARKSYPGFYTLSSTALYPEWPISKMKTTPDGVSQKVVIALLTMSSDDRAAIKGQYGGWTVPLDYQSVHALFRELNIGPYTPAKELTILEIIDRYRIWVAIFATALILSFGWAIWTERLVKRRTQELSIANEMLVDQMAMRRRLEEQASLRQNELTRIARQNSLGEMASSIAHELNHPLTTILNYVKGCTRRLETGRCDYGDIKNVLSQVSHQARHSANVIKVMMDFVRSDVREREHVDLNEIVHEVAELVSLETENRSIFLEIKDAPQKLNVYVDRVQIEQVILNIVRNAIEAIPQTRGMQGHIIMKTDREDQSHAKVTVTDNGTGIPESIKQDMFTPFVSKKNTGLGLGLSISRSILETHQGHLQVVDTSNEGSTISFSLPVA